MEQQTQTKTAARTEKTPTEERIRKSDGPRLAQTDIAAKAAMAGADLRQMPADRLRELAVRLGNSGMEVETLEGREGWDLRGVKISTPVLTRYEPVTLSKGVVGDCDFLDWIFAASAGDYTGPSGSSLRRTIDIITLNDLGQPGVTWTLSGAMPIGYEVPQLDGSRSEVLTESLTLSYTGMKRKAEARQQPQ